MGGKTRLFTLPFHALLIVFTGLYRQTGNHPCLSCPSSQLHSCHTLPPSHGIRRLEPPRLVCAPSIGARLDYRARTPRDSIKSQSRHYVSRHQSERQPRHQRLCFSKQRQVLHHLELPTRHSSTDPAVPERASLPISRPVRTGDLRVVR